MGRTIRDVLILIAFCSAFYMLTLFVGGEDEFYDRSNFSRDRLVADESYSDGDWETAIKHYDNLLQDDPFNELAISQKASADLELTEELVAEYEERKSRAGANQATIKQMDSKIAKLVANSLTVQESLLDSYRFRSRAIRNAVVLHCLGGDTEAALKALDVYVQEGAGLKGPPITIDDRLKLLWDEPKFVRLYMKERDENFYFRR